MKEIELELSCDLTQEEIQFRAQELGGAVIEYDQVEDAKRDAAKDFAEQLKHIGSRIRRLSEIIRTKSERRMVRCRVNFHTPITGTKETIRLDTGELARTERMSNDECQQYMFAPGDDGQPGDQDSPTREAGGLGAAASASPGSYGESGPCTESAGEDSTSRSKGQA